jgi:trans-2,3-dihydro-3-hydroxyanthranilate isomerase
MSATHVFTVDVFAQRRYTGNQLAVFVHEPALSDETMLALTRETNYSEATFLSASPADGQYEVRIFDPTGEIPFAGHPVLGTAAVIRERLTAAEPTDLTIGTGVGPIPVWTETTAAGDEVYWLRQIEPTFGTELPADSLATVLGLESADVATDPPVQLVSTGLPTVVVPLASLDALRRATLQPEPYYSDLIDPHGDVNLLVFASETYDGHDLTVRVFAESSGVREDPATGSSAGCLAAYLVAHEYFDATAVDCTAEQGYEIDRPSLLRLRATATDDGIDVRVGGRVFPVMHGRLDSEPGGPRAPVTCGVVGIREMMTWGGPHPDEILQEMERRATEAGFPTVGPEAGRTLALLARLGGATSAVELGSGFGYSAYWIARAMPASGRITLTERDPSLLAAAEEYFERGGLADAATFVADDAVAFADSLTGTYDLVHLDHDTADYIDGFEAVRENVAADGLVVADNVLVHRYVLSPTGLFETLTGTAAPNERTRYTAAFLDHVRDDPAFEVTLLPVDEGIAVITRTNR